tara:strand:+ start:109 stop:354 length:246 start_codon:yes stop_codon:yes gene_type:complete
LLKSQHVTQLLNLSANFTSGKHLLVRLERFELSPLARPVPKTSAQFKSIGTTASLLSFVQHFISNATSCATYNFYITSRQD